MSCRRRRRLTVTESVQNPHQYAVGGPVHNMKVPRFTFPGKDSPSYTPGYKQLIVRLLAHYLLFLVVTIVPWLSETISNSSTTLRTPGSPSPKPPAVE